MRVRIAGQEGTKPSVVKPKISNNSSDQVICWLIKLYSQLPIFAIFSALVSRVLEACSFSSACWRLVISLSITVKSIPSRVCSLAIDASAGNSSPFFRRPYTLLPGSAMVRDCSADLINRSICQRCNRPKASGNKVSNGCPIIS